jgi:hypothetical protein
MIATAVLLLALALHAGPAAAGEHLLAGATHFRDGRYAEALVEFRVAGRLGAPDASRYAGAALVKLERFEDAVDAFGGSDAPGEDPLVDYYRAVACAGAKLHACAERLLEGVEARGGPRIADQARKLREEVSAALAEPVLPSTVDAYLARCEEQRALGRTALATALCREARALAKRSGDAGRVSRAEVALAELTGKGPR